MEKHQPVDSRNQTNIKKVITLQKSTPRHIIVTVHQKEIKGKGKKEGNRERKERREGWRRETQKASGGEINILVLKE